MLSIMPKIPEISVGIQMKKVVSVSSDQNIRDHLCRWFTYFRRNRPKFAVLILTNRFFALIREFGKRFKMTTAISVGWPDLIENVVFPLISDRSVWHNGKHPRFKPDSEPESFQVLISQLLKFYPYIQVIALITYSCLSPQVRHVVFHIFLCALLFCPLKIKLDENHTNDAPKDIGTNKIKLSRINLKAHVYFEYCFSNSPELKLCCTLIFFNHFWFSFIKA